MLVQHIQNKSFYFDQSNDFTLQKVSRYNEEVYYCMIKKEMDILMKYINKKNYILLYTKLIPIMRNLSFYIRNMIQKLVF